MLRQWVSAIFLDVDAMNTSDFNLLPRPLPAKTVRHRIFGFEYVSTVTVGETRSTPNGVGSARGKFGPNGNGPTEHPTPVGGSGVNFEAAFEPQSAPTVEPKSPV